MNKLEKEIRERVAEETEDLLLNDTRPNSLSKPADVLAAIRETRVAVNRNIKDIAAISIAMEKLAGMFGGTVSLEERLSWREEDD